MASCGMWRRVGLVRANVSKEHISSVIRAERIWVLETKLAITNILNFGIVGSNKTKTAPYPRRRHSF
jgi:hypothetical protein